MLPNNHYSIKLFYKTVTSTQFEIYISNGNLTAPPLAEQLLFADEGKELGNSDTQILF